jgi:hypothetical protein
LAPKNQIKLHAAKRSAKATKDEKERKVYHNITASSDNCRLHDDAQVGDVTSIAQLFHEYGGWHSTPAVVDRIQHCYSTDHNQDGLLLSYLIDNP